MPKRVIVLLLFILFAGISSKACNIEKQEVNAADGIFVSVSSKDSYTDISVVEQKTISDIPDDKPELTKEPTPTPTNEAKPSVSPIAKKKTAKEKAKNTPTPTPTPEPTLTPEEKAATVRVEKDYSINEENLDLLKECFSVFAPTVNMSFEELVGDNGNWNFPVGFPESDTYLIKIDLRRCIIMVFKQDENGDYIVPVRFMICAPGKDSTPTPTGSYKLGKHRCRFGYFVSTGGYAQYWTQITGRIYFHSILYSECDAATYTNNSWKALGTRVSHGCVRLPVPDARWIWYNAAHGSTVKIYYGNKDDEFADTVKELLKLAPLPDSRPKLKAGKVPYTDNWNIEDIENEVPFEQGTAVRK